MKQPFYPYLLFILLSVSSGKFCRAQHQFEIDTVSYEKVKIYKEKWSDYNDLFIERLKDTYRRKNRKTAIEFYTSGREEIIIDLDKGKFSFDERYRNYIQNIIEQIQSYNPEISTDDYLFLISLSPDPNALSIGDGTFIFNLGLFSYLENRDQLASIICHEIAHQFKQHSLENINTVLLTNNKLKDNDARKMRYGRSEYAMETLRNTLYLKGETRRKQESEADISGYVFYKKAGFHKSSYIEAFESLISSDSTYSKPLPSVYQSLFTLPDYPFEKEWLSNDDFQKYNYGYYKEKIDTDSIKYHPEVEDRIHHLKNTFPDIENSKDSLQLDHSFMELKYLAFVNIVPNLYDLEDYGKSIYTILYRWDTASPEERRYYSTWLGKNFQSLAIAKGKYQFNRHVERVNPEEHAEGYLRLLNFLWNLSQDELQRIGNFYLNKNINN